MFTGTLSLIQSEATGKLYSFTKEEGCRQHVSDIGISNGLTWDLEGNQMYYIDSCTPTIDVFDYNSNGSIGKLYYISVIRYETYNKLIVICQKVEYK